MVKVTLRYECGCGYKTENQDEAIDHCVQKGHTLDIKGMVKWTGKRAEKVRSVVKAG